MKKKESAIQPNHFFIQRYRHWYIICSVMIISIGFSQLGQATLGDASIIISDGSESASITSDGNDILGFGSFYLGSTASAVTIKMDMDGVSTHNFSGDIIIDTEPTEVARFKAAVAKNSQVAISVGVGDLTLGSPDPTSSRTLTNLSFTTEYYAFMRSSGCAIPSCVSPANRGDNIVSDFTLNSGDSTDLALAIGGTLSIPANASVDLQYGAYSGTYPITVTY